MRRWRASSRLDQCVTPYLAGGGASVVAITLARSISRGRPERGSSSKPARTLAWYRSRQDSTVGRDTPTLSAIAVFDSPSAASSTIPARCANPAGAVVERVSAAVAPDHPHADPTRGRDDSPDPHRLNPQSAKQLTRRGTGEVRA